MYNHDTNFFNRAGIREAMILDLLRKQGLVVNPNNQQAEIRVADFILHPDFYFPPQLFYKDYKFTTNPPGVFVELQESHHYTDTDSYFRDAERRLVFANAGYIVFEHPCFEKKTEVSKVANCIAKHIRRLDSWAIQRLVSAQRLSSFEF